MALKRGVNTLLGSYKFALARDISPTLPAAALSSQPHAKRSLSIELANKQHSHMISVIESCGVKVFTLPSDGFPDSVFIEDTAVVLGGTVLITRPGAISRREETERVKSYFQAQSSKEVVVMEEGTLDGGDVLFTGRELLVGITHRTNERGAELLQKAFPSFPVIPIVLQDLWRPSSSAGRSPPLHLKSFCSMIGENVLAVGGDIGHNLAVRLSRYSVVHLPDMEAANCLLLNGTIVRRADEEFPESAKVFRQRGGKQVCVSGSELAKVDGALTCCSLLFS